jgi:hypothetical protein
MQTIGIKLKQIQYSLAESSKTKEGYQASAIIRKLSPIKEMILEALRANRPMKHKMMIVKKMTRMTSHSILKWIYYPI